MHTIYTNTHGATDIERYENVEEEKQGKRCPWQQAWRGYIVEQA
jgi:hypothetical protein